MKRIRITLIKSPIGYSKDQKDTLRGLGLKRMHQTVEHEANGPILGMVRKITHLVRVDNVESGGEQ
ncbi:50S ribosomal protein L30 [bacterium]|nr:50S ribosomal protein L30 [bacterium]